jgi:hypothetical protein
MVAKATAHPDRRLISSEDVQGTKVYGPGEKAIGEIDHLLIEKVSGRVTYAVMSFGGFLGLGHSHYPIRHSSTTPISAAIVRALPRDGYAMRLSSVTTRGKIGIGRPGRMSTTGFRAIGVSEFCRSNWRMSRRIDA